MNINPVYFIAFIYFIFNTIAYLLAMNSGSIMLDFKEFNFDAKCLTIAYFGIIFAIACLALIYRFYSRKTRYKSNAPKLQFGARAGWLVVTIQLAFLWLNEAYGINVAGVSVDYHGSDLLKYGIIILQPDTLVFVIGLYLRSTRLFFLNLGIYTVSMFLRGWMGGSILAGIAILIRFYPIRLSTRTIVGFILFCGMGVVLLPMMIALKWGVRAGQSIQGILENLPDYMTINNYLSAIEYLVGRFQHVGHVALLLQNSDAMHGFLNIGEFRGFWMEGLPQEMFSRLFGVTGIDLSRFMVQHFWGVADAWNTNPGLAGWIFVLQGEFPWLLLYLSLTVGGVYWFLEKYAGRRLLMYVGCLTFVYVLHGWLAAYINFVIYAVLIVFIAKCKVTHTDRVRGAHAMNRNTRLALRYGKAPS